MIASQHFGGIACIAAAARRDRRAVNQKVLPAPGVLLAPACPPISSASLFVIARPRPVPPDLRVVALSACSKALNSRASVDGSTPMPVSCTSSLRQACSPSCSSTRTRTVT